MTTKVIQVKAFSEVPALVKETAMKEIENGTEVSEVLKRIAILKVLLLADEGWQGGLNPESRKRAWRLAAEVGILLMEKDCD